ncbi:MAG: hypothetical protein GY940_01805 [bacterium]|nr:hypothetical protein [bacterium]
MVTSAVFLLFYQVFTDQPIPVSQAILFLFIFFAVVPLFPLPIAHERPGVNRRVGFVNNRAPPSSH